MSNPKKEEEPFQEKARLADRRNPIIMGHTLVIRFMADRVHPVVATRAAGTEVARVLLFSGAELGRR
jgi:hypothetical protein